MRFRRIELMVVAAALAFLVGSPAARRLGAQGNPPSREPRLARLSSRAVELLDVRTGTTKRIYRSQAWAVKEISMSPSGRYIALIEVAEGVVEGHNYSVPPSGALVILDTTGNRIRRIDRDVQRYTWFGDSRIAFVSGVYIETEMEFGATGAGVVDVTTGSITPLPGRPRAVEWAPFDSALYLAYPTGAGYRIDRYASATGQVVTTQHKGLVFSADGQFYLSFLEASEEQPSVFRARDDLPLNRAELDRIGVPVRWLPSGGSHLLVRRVSQNPSGGRVSQDGRRVGLVLNSPGRSSDADYVVFDVASGASVRRLRGSFPAWGASSNAVPILTGGRVSAITRP
jgi:hypothetical protein